MNTTTTIGILASIFIAISLLPQLIKLLKQKKAGDISLLMLLVLIIGQFLWVAYGAMKQDQIIVLSNSFSALINLVIIFFSLKYKRNNKLC